MAEAITALRTDAAQLLTRGPADALTSYYTLEHDARRVRIYLRANSQGRTLAFVAVCQTGIDLFRPLVVMRGDDSRALRDALAEALPAGRPYLLSAPPTLYADIAALCDISGDSINRVFTLEAGDFKPVMNLLVQTSKTPDGMYRASIPARDGQNAAEAGVSWISSRYAEVYVQVHESVRRRGLGKSVVSAVTQSVLDARRSPIYVARMDNVASHVLAERLGYRDSGARELSAAITRRSP